MTLIRGLALKGLDGLAEQEKAKEAETVSILLRRSALEAIGEKSVRVPAPAPPEYRLALSRAGKGVYDAYLDRTVAAPVATYERTELTVGAETVYVLKRQPWTQPMGEQPVYASAVVLLSTGDFSQPGSGMMASTAPVSVQFQWSGSSDGPWLDAVPDREPDVLQVPFRMRRTRVRGGPSSSD